MLQEDVSRIVGLIRTNPIVQSDEKAVQERIAEILDAHGIGHKREVVLGQGDIIDFMAGEGIGIEVKLKAPKRSIYRQCERYCGHEGVKALILVSATAMGLPEEIKGKPCYPASLGIGWL